MAKKRYKRADGYCESNLLYRQSRLSPTDGNRNVLAIPDGQGVRYPLGAGRSPTYEFSKEKQYVTQFILHYPDHRYSRSLYPTIQALQDICRYGKKRLIPKIWSCFSGIKKESSLRTNAAFICSKDGCGIRVAHIIAFISKSIIFSMVSFPCYIP